MEKKDYSIHILVTFIICIGIFLGLNASYMMHQEKNKSSVSVDDYVIEDKIYDSDYIGYVLSHNYYLDVAEKENMKHKKRIQVSEVEYKKNEVGDIIKLKFFYNEEDLVDVEILE